MFRIAMLALALIGLAATASVGRGQDKNEPAAAAPKPVPRDPKQTGFKVMTWNIWHGGKEDGAEVGPKRVIDVIRDSGADVVAVQETYGSGEKLAKGLGFHFLPRGKNVSILSRHPIVEDISVFQEFKCVGGLVELSGGQRVAVYSIWLPYNAEIWEEGKRDNSRPQTLLDACKASATDLEKIRTAIDERLNDAKYRGVPVFIAGDFNSMSHLDYTEANKKQFGVVIDWPTSKVLTDAGYRDSYRQLHADVDRARDRTWTPRFPKQEQDRIDFIYSRSATWRPVESRVIDKHADLFPSDHAALLTRFELGREAVGQWVMPDEAAKHKRTWMAFGAHKEIWGDLLPDVQADLARIAKTIAEFEPVTMLVRPEDRKLAERLCGAKVQLIEAPLDDLWIRDTGPVFVVGQDGKLGAVDLNFNGWGKKQAHTNDAKVARLVAEKAGATRIATTLVGEGGGLEADGAGTAIVTESCFINKNRNPGVTREQCAAELKKLLGLRTILWLPGVRGKDITDGHTDFYARFAKPGAVVAGLEEDEESFDYKVTRQHLKLLEDAEDADRKQLSVVTIPSPTKIRRKLETKEFAAGYINFYVVNGAVIAPEFGAKQADAHCRAVLEKLFPDRTVVQINIDAIAAGGGGIHCATLHEPNVGEGKQK